MSHISYHYHMEMKNKRLVIDEEHKYTSRSLPDEIVEDVLSRLPVKSLLRFKTVCKSWNRTISDPRFVDAHLRQSRKSTSQNYLIMWYEKGKGGGGSHVVRYENRKSRSVIDYPWRHKLNESCYCDGLILKYVGGNPDYVLWNPSTRSHVKIGSRHLNLHSTFLHGLCYDPEKKDYKMVIGDKNKYAVFHCRNNYWSETREYKELSFGPDASRCEGVPFAGGFYWVYETNEQNERGVSIKTTEMVFFDSRDDTFHNVPIPRYEEIDTNATYKLVVLGRYLCLVLNTLREPSYGIWCMVKKGDSWEEVNEALPFSSSYVVPVFLTNENEMIIDVGDQECFVVWDLRRNIYEKIQVSSTGGSRPRSIPCLENLFFQHSEQGKVNK